MVRKLYFKLLPVQIMIVAMGAVNSVVDGAVAGRYINAATVGVVGLYYSMVCVIQAIGNMMLGGSSVLCGRFLGGDDLRKTNEVFVLNQAVVFFAGILLNVLSFVFASPLATILGTSEVLRGDLILYIRGYAIGIIPMLLAQQLSSFLQLERQNTRGLIGVGGMIVANVILDIVLVAVLRMGVWGLALATALSNWVYFLILFSHYLTPKAQMRYRFGKINLSELPTICKIGLPGAMTVLCMALRSMAINRILLKYAGEDGLAANSAFSMVSGFIIAFGLGSGAVVRMLTSVFVGEEDRDAMHDLLQVAETRIIPLSVLVGVVTMLFSSVISAVFFPDRSSAVFGMCRTLIMIYGASAPLIAMCCLWNNYLQALGHNTFVNLFSLFDGFFSCVIPALLLAPFLGATGVWIAYPVGLILTLLLVPVYAFLTWKRYRITRDEWLFLKPAFGVSDADRLDMDLSSVEDVTRTAETVQAFCEAHYMNEKKSYYSALCLEEMAANIVEHGFLKDKRKHLIHARVIHKDDEIRLRIKDDCIPFDPKERAELLSGEDVTKNIGLRMVTKLADEMTYQNLLGLNVLTISVSK